MNLHVRINKLSFPKTFDMGCTKIISNSQNHTNQFLFNLKPSSLHLKKKKKNSKKEWTDDVYWYQDNLPEVQMHPFLAKPFQIVSQSLPCSAKK